MIVNQLKRQGEEINKLGESLETKKASESKLERQVREAQRKYADLETRMKEDLMMARIRDAENTQCVAELTQKISSLEYKVRGHFLIMLTRFWPLLTTYLPRVDICNGILLLLQSNLGIRNKLVLRNHFL